MLLATLSLPLTTVAANPATVTLSPASQVAVVGATVHLTATVKLANVPVPNVTVQFNVSGTNTVARSAVTNSQGQASFSYSSAESGSDSVTAKVGSVTSTAAAVDWIDTTAAKIAVSPSSINALVGSSQTFTATVTDSNGKGVAGVESGTW